MGDGGGVWGGMFGWYGERVGRGCSALGAVGCWFGAAGCGGGGGGVCWIGEVGVSGVSEAVEGPVCGRVVGEEWGVGRGFCLGVGVGGSRGSGFVGLWMRELYPVSGGAEGGVWGRVWRLGGGVVVALGLVLVAGGLCVGWAGGGSVGGVGLGVGNRWLVWVSQGSLRVVVGDGGRVAVVMVWCGRVGGVVGRVEGVAACGVGRV
ncbi:hypothetical protein Tco_1506253 [Tanacetum coccineum]